jgi:2-oxoglutarate ferredoxin oxidoreductase subunit alpha
MRVRAFPFAPEVEAFLQSHEHVFVVDQNRDGQLRTLIVNDTAIEKSKLRSVRHYSGTPLSADHVLEEVLPVLEPEEKAAASRVAATSETPRLHA